MMIDVRERDERVLDLEFLGFLWHTVTQRRSETYPFYKDFILSRVCSLSLCPNVDISPISTYLLLLLLLPSTC